MYVVLGMIKVRTGHLPEFIDHVRRHAAASLGEPGCVRYDVLQDHADPHAICLYEVFRSEDDLAFHHAQDYYRRWMELSRPWRDTATYTRRVLRNLHPADSEWDVRS